VPGYGLLRPHGTVSVAVLKPLAQPERIAPPPLERGWVMFRFDLRRDGTFTNSIWDRWSKGTDPTLPAAHRNQPLPTSLAHPEPLPTFKHYRPLTLSLTKNLTHLVNIHNDRSMNPHELLRVQTPR
jgi:hypothetical protein